METFGKQMRITEVESFLESHVIADNFQLIK